MTEWVLSEEPMKSAYADVLNALDAMQQSMAYAVRHQDLANAERSIVYLEEENRALQARVIELELTWTSTKPTQAGWYWWLAARIPVVLQIVTHDQLYVCLSDGKMPLVEFLGGQWAGPIAEPKEGTYGT